MAMVLKMRGLVEARPCQLMPSRMFGLLSFDITAQIMGADLRKWKWTEGASHQLAVDLQVYLLNVTTLIFAFMSLTFFTNGIKEKMLVKSKHFLLDNEQFLKM